MGLTHPPGFLSVHEKDLSSQTWKKRGREGTAGKLDSAFSGRGTLTSWGSGIWEKHWRCFAVGADFLNAHKFCTLCIQPTHTTHHKHTLWKYSYEFFSICLFREHGCHLKNNHMISQTHSGMNEGLMGLTPHLWNLSIPRFQHYNSLVGMEGWREEGERRERKGKQPITSRATALLWGKTDVRKVGKYIYHSIEVFESNISGSKSNSYCLPAAWPEASHPKPWALAPLHVQRG